MLWRKSIINFWIIPPRPVSCHLTSSLITAFDIPSCTTFLTVSPILSIPLLISPSSYHPPYLTLLVSSHLISPLLISLFSSHLTPPHLTPPHLTLLISSHLISFDFILPSPQLHHTSFYPLQPLMHTSLLNYWFHHPILHLFALLPYCTSFLPVCHTLHLIVSNLHLTFTKPSHLFLTSPSVLWTWLTCKTPHLSDLGKKPWYWKSGLTETLRSILRDGAQSMMKWVRTCLQCVSLYQLILVDVILWGSVGYSSWQVMIRLW